MSGPLKTSSRSTVKAADQNMRLEHIRRLWEQLARLHDNSNEYRALVRQIRAEADAFRKIFDSRTRADST